VSHSRRLPASIPCLACGLSQQVEAWIVIDVEARPDLLDDALANRLNRFECRGCGADLGADLPLLLFLRDAPDPFVFSPGVSTSEEQNHRHAGMIESLIRSEYADQWQTLWLRPALKGFPRARLKQWVGDARGDALRKKYEWLCLGTALAAFIEADTPHAAREVIDAHPELLHPAIEGLLSEKIADAREPGSEWLLRRTLAFLTRCRTAGVERAFAEAGREERAEAGDEFDALVLEWTRLHEHSSPEAERIDVGRRLLASLDQGRQPVMFASVAGFLGLDLMSSSPDEAVGLLTGALQGEDLLETDPARFAGFAVALGETVSASGGVAGGLLEEAIRPLERVLARAERAADVESTRDARRALAALYQSRLENQIAPGAHFGFSFDWPDETAAPGTRHGRSNAGRRFSFKRPASSIGELLAFLEADSPERYLFRGQDSDYDYLIPSRFRRGAVEKLPREGWVRVSNDTANDAMSLRQNVQAKVRSALMQRLGKGIGNIVAQQYGLGSETVDLTESPRAAAFFATRSYPTYDHFPGSQGRRLGVIYRIPKRQGPSSLESLDATMLSMGLKNPVGGVIWFGTRVAIPALVNDGDVESLQMLQSYFAEHGGARADLFTMNVRINHATLEEFYLTMRLDGVDVRAGLERSRWGRQTGGLFFPIIWHRCFIPARFDTRPGPSADRVLATPPLIAIRDIVAVNDMCTAAGFETFYFRHGPERLDGLTREYLWPGPDEDPLLAYVERVCRDVAADYIDTTCADLYDPLTGLIDRGYQ
jgi:hypothetical protein